MKSLVIGGGVIGLNIALELQKRGHDVTLLEPQHGGSVAASYGNAGHIATEQTEPLASWAVIRGAPRRLFPRGALSLQASGMGAWLPFGLRMMRAASPARFSHGKAVLTDLLARAMPAWRRRTDDLGDTGLLRADGHYIVWETPDSAREGLLAWTRADTGTASLRAVHKNELDALQGLTTQKLHGAVRFEGTGQVADTRRLLMALESGFEARGGRTLRERAVALRNAEDGAKLRLEGGEILKADTIIVCAGVASRPLLEGLGHKVPIIAERGYHIQSARHDWPQTLSPVVFEDRSLIVTHFESGIRAASFVEFNHVDAAPDLRKWARLRAHVRGLGLPFGDVDAAAEWTGARPTLPDYLPAIGRSQRASNVYYAFGHQHLGLTLGPITGEIVADMVVSGETPRDFDIERFR